MSPQYPLISTYYLAPESVLDQVDRPMWQAVGEQLQGQIQIEVIKELTHLGELERCPSDLRKSLHSLVQGRSWREFYLSNFYPRNIAIESDSSSLGLEATNRPRLRTFPHEYPTPYEQHLAYLLAGRRLIVSEIETAYVMNYSVFHSTAFSTGVRTFHSLNASNSTYPTSTLTAPPTRAKLLQALQRLYLFGYIEWLPVIGYNDGAYGRLVQAYCRRCGFNEGHKTWLQLVKEKIWQDESQLIPLDCHTCGSTEGSCLYCPQCLQLGLAKSCEPYILWAHESIQGMKADSLQVEAPYQLNPTPKPTVEYTWNETLSDVQQQASDQLLAYVQNHTSQPYSEFLVWAICGAGKTEMIFATLYDALCRGQKVLMTSPRKDVILELAPRLKAAFPATKIVVLHGDSMEKYAQGELFLATTHQCLRFYQFFDVVIVDEVDAFPYSYDRMLQIAVDRAKKQEGMLIYLSATPSDAFQRRVEKGTLPHVLISKRYHGHPLAVPQIKVIGKWRTWMQTQLISSELAQFVSHLITQKRYGYLFVPHVKDLPLVQKYLQTILLPYLEKKGVQAETPFNIEVVYAEHPQRTEIVQRFRQHHIDLLLTTTILERGVTIPFCDVGVLGSDDPVFHTAALIQMAGRAGRKIQDPVGQVYFFPESVTNSQIKCVKQIKKWNGE